MLHRLCGPPSIPLSFSLGPYSPGGALNALASALKGSNPPTPSAHRLRRGLPGYLILFAPHAFASQRQLRTRKPPSLLVFFLISTHFTATPGIPLPYPNSRTTVSAAGFRLSRKISQLTNCPAYTLFTPSKSGQRLLPPCYRGCWHGVSRSFLWRYRQFPKREVSSPLTGLFTPQSVITHAALLGQAFAHCPIFLTAASRRSLARVSVPVWLIILSDQLSIVALVGHYPTNKLIERRPIPQR